MHTNSPARRRANAFTLIEILIVVVILGILAAIVIPQFTDASDDAMTSSVRSQLQTIRSQIELFRVQNPGALPDFADAGVQWDPLIDGNYLQSEPANPFQDSLTNIAGAAADGVAWVWMDPDGAGTQDFDMFAVDDAGALLPF